MGYHVTTWCHNPQDHDSSLQTSQHFLVGYVSVKQLHSELRCIKYNTSVSGKIMSQLSYYMQQSAHYISRKVLFIQNSHYQKSDLM